MDVLFAALYGVCAQRPEHSLFIAGTQLPLEARMGGIFGGFLLGLVYCLALGRARSVRFPDAPTSSALAAFVGLTALDGLNAVLYDLGRPHLYEPDNAMRLATGLLCGFALAAFSLASVASVLWKDGEWEAPIRSLGEGLAGLGLLALAWMLVVADLPYLLYPVAVLFTAGVVLAFTVANGFFLALTRAARADTWRQLRGPLGIALGLTGVELLALGTARAWLLAQYGLTWLA